MSISDRGAEFSSNVLQLMRSSEAWQAMRARYYLTQAVVLIADMATLIESLEVRLSELERLKGGTDNG